MKDRTAEPERNAEAVITVSAAELTELAESIIRGGGTVEMESRGNSMKPMLRFESSKVRLAAPTELERGDVLLYRYPSGKCILHRLVRFDRDGTLICRGDNNLWTERVRRDWVVAKVTAFKRDGSEDAWVSCDDPAYRRYWRLWLAAWPLRKNLRRARNLAARVYRKLK